MQLEHGKNILERKYPFERVARTKVPYEESNDADTAATRNDDASHNDSQITVVVTQEELNQLNLDQNAAQITLSELLKRIEARGQPAQERQQIQA